MRLPIFFSRFAILSFLCVLGLALAMGFAISSLLTRSFSDWEWENTAALARREVDQAGLEAVFTAPRDPETQERWGREISRLFVGVPEVVRVKVWDREATVLWSDKPQLIGQRFPNNPELRAALGGKVAVEIKQLRKAENTYERGQFATLAEVYVPIFSKQTGEVLGAIEVYKTPRRLFATIWWGRLVTWAISLAGGLALHLVLLPLFRQVYKVQEETHRAYAGRLEQEVAERTQELKGKSDRLRTLNRLSRLIASTTEGQEVFDAVARAAGTLLGAQMARVWVADLQDRVLRIQGRFNVDPKFEELMADLTAIPYGKGVAGAVFESRVPEYLSDIGADSRWLNPRLASEAGLHAFAGIPLVAGDRAVGVLSILFGERRHFTPEEKELMGLLADQAATALENARLLWEARSRQARLEALLEVNRQLSRLQPVESLLRTIAETCGSLVGADSVGFRLVEGDELVVVGTWGEGQEVLSGRRLKVGESLSGLVAASGEPLLVRDAAADPRLIEEHRAQYRRLGLRAFLGVPVRVGERVLGVLSLRTRREEGFSRDDLTVAAAFASQAVITLENSRLYGELRRALEELECSQRRIVETERLRALGEMAGGVAHDFNNLLAAILGRAQYLLLRLAEGAVAPEEARRSLTVIERAARDGGETVRRLLEFTRATPRLTEAEAVNVKELVASVVAAAQPRWKDEAEAWGAHIEVVQEVGSVSPVVGNAAELREVLLNLVFNAIEAMPEGGTLTLSSWAEGENVWLAVKDTGVGIPEEIRSRIFDPFFTTKGVQSSGLGLSVSYGIIHRHGGEITVESRPGRGTTFTVRLPRREAPVPQREAAPSPAAAGLRVLVVDDEEDVREALRDLLRAVGPEVYEAGSGPEGLKVLEAQEVELVCTDLGMPGMTGWEVAERVKARWPGLAVALITGWGAGIDAEELKAHGVNFLITKPFEMDEIQRVLSEVARSIGVGR